jgi:signal transduction histidine kinase
MSTVSGIRDPSESPARLSGGQRVQFVTLAIAAAAVLVYLFLVGGFPGLPATWHLHWWSLAALFYVSEISVFHLQFKRDAYSFSLAEIPLVLGLFFAAPHDLILGQMLGTAVALGLHRRQSILKVAFNLSHYALETGFAAAIFYRLASHTSMLQPLGWAGVLLATLVAAFTSVVMVVLAISASEGSLRMESLPQGLLYGSIVTVTNTSLALLGVSVVSTSPHTLFLLAVPTILLFLSYRAYMSQREQRESIEFLYESTRMAHRSLQSQSALTALCTQARKMFRAEVASITLFGAEEGKHARLTTLGPGDSLTLMEEVELHPTEGVWARVASEEQAVLIPRPIQNERLRDHFAERGIFKDAMVAPLLGEGGVVGTIMVGDRLGDVSSFDLEDLKLFETLANHASVSLENAGLVDRLKDSLAHLTEMNRLKDDFVAAVSHELRTPLTSIQGYVKTLLRPEVDFEPDQQRSFLEAVDRQSDRLRNLIEDLLAVSRLESEETQAASAIVSLPTLVDRVVDELGERKASHPIELDFEKDCPVVVSDEGKIHQILLNLVDNAFKYTPDGRAVTVQGRREGEGVVLSIIDRGDGIDPEFQDRIFDRFYQVDQSSTRKVGGTGLGLYICRRLGEAIGGRVWLERSGPDGSVFSLWLPLTTPQVARVLGQYPISGTPAPS